MDAGKRCNGYKNFLFFFHSVKMRKVVEGSHADFFFIFHLLHCVEMRGVIAGSHAAGHALNKFCSTRLEQFFSFDFLSFFVSQKQNLCFVGMARRHFLSGWFNLV
jgi:hypothetical protein